MCAIGRVCCLLCLFSSFAATSFGANSPLESIERRIRKEPRYESSPQYVLLALGAEAKPLVWLVEDGRKLYIDQNANSDLTDDGPPLTPTNERVLIPGGEPDKPKSWDFEYVLEKFAPANGPEQTDFKLSRWNYGDSDKDRYGLSFTLDGKIPMYAGWVSFWAPSAEKASIIHFGGPLTPQSLRFKKVAIGGKENRLSMGFFNAGLGKGADARLSIDAVTADVMPEVRIQWPTMSDQSPLETRHTLNHRCCYWEFYMLDFSVPKDAIPGTAKATIVLPLGALPIPLAKNSVEIPVVATEPTAPKAE